MSVRYKVVVNKAAGGGRHVKDAEYAVTQLSENLDVDVSYTERAGHATEIVKEAVEQGFTHFVSVGGDGTSFEMVNGLFDAKSYDRPPTLGIVPLGTGNSFVRDFGGVSSKEAVSRIVDSGKKHELIDIVRADHSEGFLHYINILGLGFTADAGALMNERFKSLGTFGYVASVVLTLAQIKYPIDGIRIDNKQEDARPAAFLSFSNSRYTGGNMMMAPHASLSDGKLDVIRVNRMGRLSFLGTFPSIFSGKHVEHPRVEETTASRVEFVESRVQNVMVDGEIYPLALKSLEVVPSALRVIV